MRTLTFMLVATCFCGLTIADEPQEIFSGPQPGEEIQPLNVQSVRADDAGKSFDLVAEARGGPLLVIFFHEKTRPAFGLTNTVARFAETRFDKGLSAGIVFLTADATATESWLKTVNNNLPKKIYLGISPDGQEGPGTWGLNRSVAVTVIVVNEGKVTANFALRQPSVDVDGPRIFQAIADVTGGGRIPEVSVFSGSPRMAARDGAAKNSDIEKERVDSKLRELLRPVISRTATKDEVNEAAVKVEEAAATDAAFRARVCQAATRIIEAGKLPDYGTPAAQEFLTKWAKDFAEPAKDDAVEKPNKNDAKQDRPTAEDVRL